MNSLDVSYWACHMKSAKSLFSPRACYNLVKLQNKKAIMSHQFLPTGDNLSLMMIILEVIVIIQVSKSGLLHCNFWTHLCIYTDH